jgi:threonine 3-dehydrogenase
MAKLITGGSGQVGAALAHQLVNRGEEIVIFDIYKSKNLGDIENKFQFVRGDLGIWSEVMNVIKDYKITQIYHMGAMLTSASEANPWASFQANVVGTYNVLEASRLLGIEKMMFTSSIGTFGMSPDPVMSDMSLQRPRDFYGAGKLYCEGLGRWYNRKFGLDFRGVRYNSVVGPVATPGHWDAAMVLDAVAGKPYECRMPRNASTSFLYYKDAALAADLIMQAPKASIQMMNYNIGGIPKASPEQLEMAIKKLIPGAVVIYPPAGQPGQPGPMTPRTWDDSYARKEWGWQPQYDTVEKMVTDLIGDLKQHPELY